MKYLLRLFRDGDDTAVNENAHDIFSYAFEYYEFDIKPLLPWYVDLDNNRLDGSQVLSENDFLFVVHLSFHWTYPAI